MICDLSFSVIPTKGTQVYETKLYELDKNKSTKLNSIRLFHPIQFFFIKLVLFIEIPGVRVSEQQKARWIYIIIYSSANGRKKIILRWRTRFRFILSTKWQIKKNFEQIKNNFIGKKCRNKIRKIYFCSEFFWCRV